MMRLELFGISGMNFVEFNMSSESSIFNPMSETSKFLDTDVFNLFMTCFESANPTFEYFGATKFSARFIVPLYNELLANLQEINAIKSEDDLIDYLSMRVGGKHFMASIERQDKKWLEHSDKYAHLLLVINKDLLNLVDRCIEEGRVLWVIGY